MKDEKELARKRYHLKHHTLREAHERIHGRKKMEKGEVGVGRAVADGLAKSEGAALAEGIARAVLGRDSIVLPYGCPSLGARSHPPVLPTMWFATLEAARERGGLAFIHLKCAHCGDSVFLEVPEPGSNSAAGERLAKARGG